MLIPIVSLLASLLIVSTVRMEAGDDTAPSAATLEQLENRIADIVDNSNVVGASVALVDGESVFWTAAFGMSDQEAGIPATPATRFRVGSISKSITGLITMMLVEEGKLDLDTPLRDIAPEIEFTNRWEATAPVRLANLMEHTTGWDDIHFREYRSFPEGTTIAEGLADNPQSRTSRWKPGQYASYANSGPAVMGYVIESVTGEDFSTLAREKLFDPLELETATLRQTATELERQSKSYNAGGDPVPATRIWAGPSGSFAATARDLGEIVRLYINRGVANNIAGGKFELLSETSIERIETPQTSLAARNGLKLGYGLGNYATLHDGIVYHGHDGAIDGFIASFGYRLDAGEGFVVQLNSPDSEAMEEIRKLLTDYIAARHNAPPALRVSGTSVPSDYDGWYRQATPRWDMFAILSEAFDIIQLRSDGSTLNLSIGAGVDDKVLYPVSNGQFAEEGAGGTLFSIVETSQGPLIHRDFNATYKPVSAAALFTPIIILVATFLFGLTGVLSTLIWCIGRSFGAFRSTNRWRVWLWPGLSYVALTSLIANLLAISGGGFEGAVTSFTGPEPRTVMVQVSSLLMPLFAITGIWAAFRAKDVSVWTRGQAGVSSAVLTLLSAWLSMYGWIGIALWDYTPRVTG